jgi:hypothetical protein
MMDNWLIALLPFLAILVLYILIFSKKVEFQRVRKSWRNYDWMTFLSCVFGGVIFSSTMRSSGAGFQAPVYFISTVVTVAIIALVIIALIRRSRTGKPVVQMLGDERTEMILAKSARNAFFATYLTLFIHTCISDTVTLDADWMMIVLGSGLGILLLSLPYYTYMKS